MQILLQGDQSMKTPICLAMCLALAVAATPALAGTLYDNGSINGETGAWDIINGFVVSDTFTLSSSSQVNGFSFAVWNECEGCGDMTSVQWSMTSNPNGGTVYASGIATLGGGSGGTLTSQFLYTNSFGYGIDLETVSGLSPNLNSGTYWLNLQNALGGEGYFFWDENSGAGCGGDNGSGGGCPSQANDSGIGTIPSESFTIMGNASSTTGGTTPEPGNILLFGSGMLGLAGLVRRRLQ